MLRRIVLLLLWHLTTGYLGAFAQNAPKYSNEFLNIGVNARAMALSNAQTATVADVSAGYWNPAGLVHSTYHYEGTLTHAEYFAGIAQYDYMGFSTNIDSSSRLAVSLIRFGVDDIPDTRFLYDANGAINYNNIRYFSASDYAFLLSYAKKTALEGLSWGSNFKIIYRQAGDFATAWGFGLDMGIQYRRGSWFLGAMARDITGTYTTWSHNVTLLYNVYAQTGNKIPKNSVEITLPRLHIGIARQFRWKQFGILPQVECPLTFDGMRNTLIRSASVSIDPSMGIELDYQRMAYLRFGAGNLQQIKDFDGSRSWNYQINFGAGFHFKSFTIDYALTDLGDNAEGLYSHVFSLKVGFNK